MQGFYDRISDELLAFVLGAILSTGGEQLWAWIEALRSPRATTARKLTILWCGGTVNKFKGAEGFLGIAPMAELDPQERDAVAMVDLD
jgi:hypothetical protein